MFEDLPDQSSRKIERFEMPKPENFNAVHTQNHVTEQFPCPGGMNMATTTTSPPFPTLFDTITPHKLGFFLHSF